MSNNMTIEQKTKMEWVWRIGMGIVGSATLFTVAAIGWFIRDIYISQKTFNAELDQRVRVLEIFRAESASSSFSAADWITSKAILDDRDVNLDKRITRVEDAIPAIKQSLERIEIKLDKKQ